MNEKSITIEIKISRTPKKMRGLESVFPVCAHFSRVFLVFFSIIKHDKFKKVCRIFNRNLFGMKTENFISEYSILKLINFAVIKILIINGPNLNLLGTREPEIYGKISMEDYLETLKKEFAAIQILYFQSNIEGEIIDKIQENDFDALIINAGAFSHYSYAIADALKNIQKTKIEVHISNIYKREEFRQKSVTAACSDGLITGFGMESYRLAMLALQKK
jgi:3-dehydroquinate dehydratase-2